MGTERTKVFILGLDGATFDFIQPMVEAGRLPHIARLMRDGACATLGSVIPPSSAPAWVSFATGKNPGKHGVYAFHTPLSGRYDVALTTSYSVRAQTVWDYLGEHGSRVAVVGVPITFPPQPVNGIMISGQPVPSSDACFTYPSTLHSEILINCGEYVMPDAYFRPYFRRDLLGAIAELARYTDSTLRAVLYLMESRSQEYFAVVFYTTDVAQHFGLRFQNEEYCRARPREAEKLRNVVEQMYEKMDGVLGEIWRRLDEDTTIIVMSDHGAHPMEGRFYLNRWLIKQGYLSLKRSGWPIRLRPRIAHPRFADAAQRIGISPRLLGRLGDVRIPVPRPGPPTLASSIDWAHTRAYAGITSPPVFITINLRGRQPHGAVEENAEYEQLRTEIIERLKGTKDHLGRPVFDRISRRVEIYRGCYVHQAPDIELETVERRIRLMKDIDPGPLSTPPRVPQGMHHMDGVIFLRGKHIRPGVRLSGAQITDVTPTAIHLMGLPIPDDMDGSVLVEALEPDWLAAHPPRTTRPAKRQGPPLLSDEVISEEERRRIEKSLEALGYL